jgi:hypothetical protein
VDEQAHAQADHGGENDETYLRQAAGHRQKVAAPMRTGVARAAALADDSGTEDAERHDGALGGLGPMTQPKQREQQDPQRGDIVSRRLLAIEVTCVAAIQAVKLTASRGPAIRLRSSSRQLNRRSVARSR